MNPAIRREVLLKNFLRERMTLSAHTQDLPSGEVEERSQGEIDRSSLVESSDNPGGAGIGSGRKRLSCSGASSSVASEGHVEGKIFFSSWF